MFDFFDINIEPMADWFSAPALTTTKDNFVMTNPPNTKLIPLTQDKFAIVDAEDYDRINKFKWRILQAGRKIPKFYAVREIKDKSGKEVSELMHRVVIGASCGRGVDHRNNDGLDNRKSNLRKCSQSQNGANQVKRNNATSKFKGVCWITARKIW